MNLRLIPEDRLSFFFMVMSFRPGYLPLSFSRVIKFRMPSSAARFLQMCILPVLFSPANILRVCYSATRFLWLRFLPLWLVFFSVDASVAQSVVINEIMSSNSRTLADEDGDYSDWIEFFNSGDQPVRLHHWGLTDDPARRYRWTFPDVTLPPGEYLLVWASGKNRRDPDRPLHANFSLSREGEPLLLRNLQGILIDSVPPVAIPRDFSYGRKPDGSDNWGFFEEPTPGASNTTSFYEELVPEPVFLTADGAEAESGFYEHPFDLVLQPVTEQPGTMILYTLDGSDPDPDHLDTLWYTLREGPNEAFTQRSMITYRYEEPLRVEDQTDREGGIHLIPTSYQRYRLPVGAVARAMTVKAAEYRDGRMGPVAARTYFIGERFEPYRVLPVLSVITPEPGFFGYDTGIMVPGADYFYGVGPYAANYMNRGEEWERRARLQYFLPDGRPVLDQDAGVRIHGGTSRRYALKSMRLYARADYGARYFEYPFFDDRPLHRYKRLKLRNAGQDITHTHFRDGLMSTLMQDSHVDVESFQPVQVFLNGEYWGIINLRERFDRYYVEERYGVAEHHVDILDSWFETNTHFQEFRDLLEESEPGQPDFFSSIAERIDLLSLFDLRIADIYFGRWDIHHWRLWRDRSRNDSKWRWNLWDMDVGMALPNNWGPEWTHFTQPETNYLEPFLTHYHATMFNRELQRILENPAARQLFINRFADHLNTRFRSDRVRELITSYHEMLEPAMADHIDRWRPPSGIESVTAWHGHVAALEAFADQRPGYVRDHLGAFFDLEPVPVTIGRIGTCGLVAVSTLDPLELDSFPWSAVYFSGNPVTLKAETGPNCVFNGWEEDGNPLSEEESVTWNPRSGAVIIALFTRDVSAETERPFRTRLLPNYPNPFNSQTTLRFTLENGQPVRLSVYDLLGQKVAEIATGFHPPGAHEVKWDARVLSSGVYVIVLETDGRRYLQKATLVR